MEVWKKLMVNDVNSIGKYFRQLISKWEFEDSDYYCYYNCLSEIDYFFLYITLGYYWATITAVQNWLLFFMWFMAIITDTGLLQLQLFTQKWLRLNIIFYMLSLAAITTSNFLQLQLPN